MNLNKAGEYVQSMCEGGGRAFRIGSGVRKNLGGTWKFEPPVEI